MYKQGKNYYFYYYYIKLLLSLNVNKHLEIYNATPRNK